MKINKVSLKMMYVVMPILLSCCNYATNNENTVIKESSNLTKDDISSLDKEYSGFITKALTQNYLDKKIRSLATQTNDIPLVKEIEYARLKHSVLLKKIICSDSTLYSQIISSSKTNINSKLNSDPIFSSYLKQSNCNNFNKIVYQTTIDDTTNNANVYARNWEIYTMDANGANKTRITTLVPSGERHPSWNPDKTKITFTSNINPGNEIYTMDANGTNQVRTTSLNVDSGVSVYSPDGSKIAFQTTRDGNWEIYTMNSNGSNLFRLTNNSSNDYVPSWSPDGTKIIFTSNRDGDYDLYTISPNGTGLTNVTNNTSNESVPRFSPNSDKIAFHSDKDGDTEIYTMNLDGSNLTKLTNNTSLDENATWSPDGDKIAFQSNRDGNTEIYVMNADGTNQTRLTNNTKEDWYPFWAN